MLTVPEAARRVRRDPETVRRWIRTGKLRARKIGTQHFIEEDDLVIPTAAARMLPAPRSWGLDRTFYGEPMPNVVAWIRRSREGH